MITHPHEPPATEILDRITDGFLAVDTEWRITYLNRAAVRMLRTRPDQLVGRNLWEAYPDVIGTRVETEYRRAASEQVTAAFEYYYAPLDLWAGISVYPSPTGLSIYVQDVSARKRVEAALVQSEARNRMIVETAHEGIWLVDAAYRTVFANPRMEQMMGVSRGALEGRRVEEFVYEGDLPLLREKMTERMAGRPAQYDIRMRRADGSTFWVMAHIAPVVGADGRFEGALGMLTDISDRKAMEQEIRSQREWLRVALTSIGDGVIATDAEGHVTFMNQVAEELTAWAFEDARGRSLEEVFRIVNEQTRQPVENPVSKVLRENRIVGLANHTSLIARDGSERPIDDSGAPIRHADGTIQGVILVFRDNSLRAQAERELREADRRKDEFLAVLAHELRNPLAPIRSALDLMRLSDQTDVLARARQIVERQLEHMTRLIDDLLDVSRITQGKIALRREVTTITAAVQRAIETVSPLITKRRQVLETKLPDTLMLVHADPTRLAQILANLLHNASKFTPPEGRILLTAELEEGKVVLRVRDEGCGIDADALAVIFEAFRQVDSRAEGGGGLGLGLTLVRSLVELHGGRVTAHSEGAGRGSELVVELPLAKDDAPVEEGGAPFPQLAGRRIFVVDDNVDAADSLSSLLSLVGHEVEVSYGPEAALSRIPEAKPEVVLLDLGLPGMDGHELARRLRLRPSLEGLKIIAVSGYGQDEDKRKTREAGFDAHLVKPVDLEAIQALLRELLEGPPG